jgi:hypothetical protein
MGRHYIFSGIITVNGNTTVLPAEGEEITVGGVKYKRPVDLEGLTVLPISGDVTFAVGSEATSSHKTVPADGEGLTIDAANLPLGASTTGQVNLYAGSATTVQVMW